MYILTDDDVNMTIMYNIAHVNNVTNYSDHRNK